MSKGKINITISGGNSDFGNVVQGDENIVSLEKHREHLDKFYAEIQQLSASNRATEDQIDSLKEEIENLTENCKKEGLSALAKRLYEQYSWALEPLKKLFYAIVP